MNRKKFLSASLFAVVGISVGTYITKFRNKNSGNFNSYFDKLNKKLKLYKRAIPSLIVDLDIVDKNIIELKKIIKDPSKFRIVDKSLPSVELIEYLKKEIGTNRIMSFHQPFLSKLSSISDNKTDILLGKPMPVQTASYYYDTLKTENGFEPHKQLQWLVDSYQRIEEYIALAKLKNLKLQLNCEIDVGLHRGGFDSLDSLEKALQLIENNSDYVSFSGFMGYDVFIVKVPELLLSRKDAYKNMHDFYTSCINLVKEKHTALWNENLTFNGAGSPTILLHSQNESPLNDISAGSFVVKPSDFDIDTLDSFSPACFISTPVLKKYKNTYIPSLEKYSGILNFFNSNNEQSFYIYGGSWMAQPHSPEGFTYSSLFGKSTNQVMINASLETKLNIGDFVFLRPHQSEAVFLQFEDILIYKNGNFESEFSLI